jgi:hypothetical protein
MPLKYGKAALLKLELLEAPPSVKARLAHENMDRLLGRHVANKLPFSYISGVQKEAPAARPRRGTQERREVGF